VGSTSTSVSSRQPLLSTRPDDGLDAQPSPGGQARQVDGRAAPGTGLPLVTEPAGPGPASTNFHAIPDLANARVSNGALSRTTL